MRTDARRPVSALGSAAVVNPGTDWLWATPDCGRPSATAVVGGAHCRASLVTPQQRPGVHHRHRQASTPFDVKDDTC